MGPDQAGAFRREACLAPAQIDKVLLVGGSTRIPAVQDAVQELYGQRAVQGHQPG